MHLRGYNMIYGPYLYCVSVNLAWGTQFRRMHSQTARFTICRGEQACRYHMTTFNVRSILDRWNISARVLLGRTKTSWL